MLVGTRFASENARAVTLLIVGQTATGGASQRHFQALGKMMPCNIAGRLGLEWWLELCIETDSRRLNVTSMSIYVPIYTFEMKYCRRVEGGVCMDIGDVKVQMQSMMEICGVRYSCSRTGGLCKA